jgi:hypothetical protein
VVSGERRGRGLQRYSVGQAKRKGWRSRLRGLLSPAPITTRSRPHGVGKCTRNAHLEQSVLFMAVRRPWTVSVSRRRSAGAFFVGSLGRGTLIAWTMPVCGCWSAALVSAHPNFSGHLGTNSNREERGAMSPSVLCRSKALLSLMSGGGKLCPISLYYWCC